MPTTVGEAWNLVLDPRLRLATQVSGEDVAVGKDCVDLRKEPVCKDARTDS